MKLEARTVIYILAAAALVIGALAYTMSEVEHEHEEEGLLEGDIVKVAAVGAVLAVVAGASFVYLLRKPPEET